MAHVYGKADDDQLRVAERMLESDGVGDRRPAAVLQYFQDVPAATLDVGERLPLVLVRWLRHQVMVPPFAALAALALWRRSNWLQCLMDVRSAWASSLSCSGLGR